MPDASSKTILQPLVDFFDANDRPLPTAVPLEPTAMPQPYRQLLVHDNDMTPTLENFHGVVLTLAPQRIVKGDMQLQRCVLLKDVATGRIIEFGAILIQLAGFDWQIQEEIRGCKTPLGSILGHNHIEHTCKPSAYFSIDADELIADVMNVEPNTKLYGRRNGLAFPDGSPLADVVEILPPTAKDTGERNTP